VIDGKPALQFGNVLRLEPITKLDVLGWTSDVGRDSSELTFDRRRLGVEGRFLGVVAFEIEHEFGDDEQPWRDVFAEFRHWRAVRVRGGRFKIPFGEERLTSVASIDFVHRSLASEALTPGRDTGFEVNGRVAGRILSYKVGAFRHDGDVSRKRTDESGGRTVAGTLTIAPFGAAESKALSNIELGAGATIGDVPEGLNGLHALTAGGFEAVAPHFVSGQRLRLGAHAKWSAGGVTLAGEYLQARDERLGQGLAGDDLADVIGRGGYVSGTWTFVGDLKGSGPKEGLNVGRPGAMQLAARAEWLGFATPDGTGEVLRNPRADNILTNDIRSATIGVNWYPIRFVRLQFNLIREELSDPERRPDAGRSHSYIKAFRIQFAM
jgi:phosphate-selective porin